MAKPGLIQTGIRYPNAINDAVFKLENVDGSVVEFDGGLETDFGFELSDYILDEIEVNYENSTRGVRMKDLGENNV